jgi:outer membrane protein assembly factor BamB
VWEGLVFVGSDDGYLYGLDRETGARVWRYRTGGAIAAGPSVAGGKLYVGSTDRNLHAFTLEVE